MFNPGNGTEQYNVVNASSCASPGLDVVFQPVVFWFYLNTNSPEVASVYCNPTMNVFTVGTSMNLSNGALGPCTILVPSEDSNNVTGSPLNGRPYNGYVLATFCLPKAPSDPTQSRIQRKREFLRFFEIPSH